MKKNLIELVNFGEQPLANDFLKNPDDKFSTYPLQIGFDPETYLVQLMGNAPKELMFNNNYVYDSSKSETMVKHFKEIANNLDKRFKPKSILEIGSNSGIFINNFPNNKSVAIEPCENFANRTLEMGIPTYTDYWNEETANNLEQNYGKFDLVFSSNTISHIHDLDSTFKGLKNILSEDGVIVIESPSLKSIIENNIIDQFYHEHQSYFSLNSMILELSKYDLKVFDIEEINVHGGSYRFYIKHYDGKEYTDYKLGGILVEEDKLGLDNPDKLKESFEQMIFNLQELKAYLELCNSREDHVICYGATAKLSLILNLAKIDDILIDYVLDTTPEKQNKYIPGTGIMVLPYSKELLMKSDKCFLGAWNYKDEIIKKEQDYLDQGKRFLTHIPYFDII